MTIYSMLASYSAAVNRAWWTRRATWSCPSTRTRSPRAGAATWTVTAVTDEDEAPESGLSMEVSVASADGTATAPDDHAAVDETVTFVPGDFARRNVQGVGLRYVATKTGTVAIVDDVTVEGDEAFALAMTRDSGGTGWVTGIDEVEVAIEDDDRVERSQVTADPTTIVEGERRTVRLTARIVRVDGEGTVSVPAADDCVVPFPVRSCGLAVGGTRRPARARTTRWRGRQDARDDRGLRGKRRAGRSRSRRWSTRQPTTARR